MGNCVAKVKDLAKPPGDATKTTTAEPASGTPAQAMGAASNVTDSAAAAAAPVVDKATQAVSGVAPTGGAVPAAAAATTTAAAAAAAAPAAVAAPMGDAAHQVRDAVSPANVQAAVTTAESAIPAPPPMPTTSLP